uniref:CCD97-like C-terminal domain-containing protein n=2 Tax=Palpitomonas bilix TaxID=652834 RepID=A0A7S3CZA0_9EUKA|mmetsp:Transcript_15659/g.39761  ORF Transcript_15659/g.39761 Transcript_15659/m.39761 type:complete len:268 (+) Transcript_15659:81-884(+)
MEPDAEIDPLDVYMLEIEREAGVLSGSARAEMKEERDRNRAQRVASISSEESGSRSAIFRNRRYEKAKELLIQGEYFTEYHMRRRDPELFRLFYGDYVPCTDVKCGERTFVDFLYGVVESRETSERMSRQDEASARDEARFRYVRDEEGTPLHGGDALSTKQKRRKQDNALDTPRPKSFGALCSENGKTEAAEMQHKVEGNAQGRCVDVREDLSARPDISREDEEEFLSLMVERFLSGRDEEFFDYRTVDNDERWYSKTTECLRVWY